jgi:PfaD family protein
MGAAYVLTGTVNQACIESGLSTEGKAQLALAKIGDVTMTPASDMFEQGVKLQVLKKGTLYPTRAAKLYALYVQYNSIDAIPEAQVKQLETQIFQKSISQVWQETQQFWQQRDVSQLEKAATDPKHKMALIFRSYLGLSSRWAMAGTTERKLDYQIWCGPAIAAFNQWTAGSFLENPQQRTVVQVALNLLEGAATCMRISQLRTYGVHFNASDFNFTPRPIQEQKHSYQKSA